MKSADSALVTRMTSDYIKAQAGWNLVYFVFLRSPFIVFGAMAMSFYGRCVSGNGFVVVIPLLSVGVFWDHTDYNASLYKERVQSYLGEILLKARENLYRDL